MSSKAFHGSSPGAPHGKWWIDGVAEVCQRFQMDLSCLIDGELDERAAARAMLHLEECAACREFFDETRRCVSLHLDMSDPSRLLARISILTGGEIADQARSIELVHRLATVFYQLGKAYVLAATDPDFRTRVFEDAVPVEPTQIRGRGFVDGVLQSGQGEAGGVDWSKARNLLNGRLKQIQSPLEKGRKLLTEAIAADPSHEEARIYLAFLHAHEGKRLQAAREFRDVFNTGISDTNRGHAAVQLGLLHMAEGDYKKALACFRWVRSSGLERSDPRFFFIGFNLGLQHALLGEKERALGCFRELLDAHPDRIDYMVPLFAGSQSLRKAIEADSAFGEELLRRCPEIFQGGASSAAGGESDDLDQDDFESSRDQNPEEL